MVYVMKNKKKIQKRQIEIRHISKNSHWQIEAKRVKGNARIVTVYYDEYDSFPPGIWACSNHLVVV